MIVERHMIKKKDLELVRANETIGEVIEKLEDRGFLSIPVVDEGKKDLIGILYKSSVYEEFFRSGLSQEEYFSKSISEILTPKTVEIQANSILENASDLLSDAKQSFIPVYKEKVFVGILTPTSIFKVYSDLLGIGKGTRLTLLVSNMSGRLAILSKAVADLGGDIISFSVEEVKLMSTARIVIRVENCDIDKLLKNISKHGFKMVRIDE